MHVLYQLFAMIVGLVEMQQMTALVMKSNNSVKKDRQPAESFRRIILTLKTKYLLKI